MNVHILIIDDENVSAAPQFFDEDFNLKCSRRLEFFYCLHADFRKGGNGDPVGVKELRYAEVPGKIEFSKLLDILANGSAEHFWIIYLDLKWDSAGLPTKQSNCFFEEYNDMLNLANRSDRPGLALAIKIMSNDSWRGLLCVESGTNVTQAEMFLNGRVNTNDNRKWTCLPAPIRTEADNASDYFFEGIEKFEQLFGSKGLIRYWLIPPCSLNTWFHVDAGNHNPKSKRCCQYKDLPKCFGASPWWEADQGKFTKPLFEIEKSAMTARAPNPKSRNIKAGMVPLLFRNSIILDGLAADAEIAIPVQPGLPFLFAVKEAFEKAREENNEQDFEIKYKPLLLKKENGKIMICLRQTMDASGLVIKVNENSIDLEDDGVSGAIYRALHAKVIPPIDLATRAGCEILNGTNQPVASVEWAADMKELRIFWPVSNERKPQ